MPWSLCHRENGKSGFLSVLTFCNSKWPVTEAMISRYILQRSFFLWVPKYPSIGFEGARPRNSTSFFQKKRWLSIGTLPSGPNRSFPPSPRKRYEPIATPTRCAKWHPNFWIPSTPRHSSDGPSCSPAKIQSCGCMTFGHLLWCVPSVPCSSVFFPVFEVA